jgi:signal peptidase I
MNKRLFSVYLPISLAILVGLYLLAKVLGLLGTFKMNSDSMMPTYAPGELLFVCKWPNLGRNDAVAYYDTSLAIPGYREAKRDLFLGRIVATGGDRLEMSQGKVFLNGQPSEQDAALYFFWTMDRANYQANQRRFDSPSISMGPDSVMVALEEPKAAEIQKHVPMHLYDFPIKRPEGGNPWGALGGAWTMNTMGPITIPPGFVFILGDHRHNSEDSRLRGLVPETDIFGKVIF